MLVALRILMARSASVLRDWGYLAARVGLGIVAVRRLPTHGGGDACSGEQMHQRENGRQKSPDSVGNPSDEALTGEREKR